MFPRDISKINHRYTDNLIYHKLAVGTKYTITSLGLIRAGTSNELSLVSKLGRPCAGVRFTFDGTPALLGQWSPPSYQGQRAWRSSAPELGAVVIKDTVLSQSFRYIRDAARQKVTCMTERLLSATMPSMETPVVDHQQLAMPQWYGGVSSLLIDTTVGAYRRMPNPSLLSDGATGTPSHMQGWNTKGNVMVLKEARRREMGSTDQSESQALVSEGSRERGRGQGRGHHRGTGKGRWRSQARGRTVRCFYCDQEGHIKRDCPKYKVHDQSLNTAATAVMADDDEIEVLLAASEDGKSDWVLDSGSAYHLYRDREVFSTYAACEGRIWMANNTSCRVVGRGSVRFRMAYGRSVTLTEGKKTRGLYRLEENVQTGGATVRHGSNGISKKNGQGKQPLHRGTQSKRRGTWRIQSGTRAQGDALGYVRKSGQTRVIQPVHDIHREAQRKKIKSILRSCTTKGAAMPKRVSFALDLISGGVLSSCAHKGGEMEPRQLAK
ncbi:hypothetical protein Acr_00g0037280 [Actinidia rufa]|uniref:CCHC-type domain-containing protein n=1 Tax=Actinidia rufa TaxID=165716 RepID=A0A7J0DH92_9ERIC|nr:hypothetical protein Acr_00g0037280 [Actinidia rufa]